MAKKSKVRIKIKSAKIKDPRSKENAKNKRSAVQKNGKKSKVHGGKKSTVRRQTKMAKNQRFAVKGKW